MGTVHIATLFLPYTASFDADENEPSPEPSPKALKRNSSLLTLTSRASSLTLFGGPASSLTPRADTEEALNANPFDVSTKRNSRVLQKGDQLNLFHSDADAPDWGSSLPHYNQPRSRAGPLPSRSILDFDKLYQQALRDNDREPRRTARRGTVTSRSASGGREYEQWTVKPAVRGNNGLINAIRAAALDDDLRISWVGTLDFPTDAVPEETRLEIRDTLTNDFDSEVIFVSDKDFDGHYSNYCKVMLWPIFHYQVADHPKSKAYMDHSWKFYFNVNRAFADQLIESYKRDDTIWVHDYHLLLVPGMVRERLPDARIGFFLHTAFPSSEVFRCQMKYKDLLKGMLGANLVAFQLQEYAVHFLQTCSRFLNLEVNTEGVQLEDRFVNVTDQPIGINPRAIEAVVESHDFFEAVRNLKKTYEGKHLIVARDKLDYVHGVRSKLVAYEQFLDRNPERAEDTVLLQIITSTHEQTELMTGIGEVCNRIDRKHASLTKHPLVLLKQDLESWEHYALLTVADILMNSTTRDGMNLLAHEFIFCQKNKTGATGRGALILSEFAGSATVLRSDHLRINPWDIRQQAETILSALIMDQEERERHWKPLYNIVMKQTGSYWFRQLSDMLSKVAKEQHDRSSTSVPRLATPQITKAYEQARKRLFILDWEGTLIANPTSAGALLASPHHVIEVVTDLMLDPKNMVYIMSGSSHLDLAQLFKTAEGLGLIAENGCYLREPHHRVWQEALAEDQAADLKDAVRVDLQSLRDKLEGSVIEERECSVVFHTGGVIDQDFAAKLVGGCIENINSHSEDSRFHAVPMANGILVEFMDASKGKMAKHMFDFLTMRCNADGDTPPDFMVVAGNDREDEGAFQWANDLAEQGAVKSVFTVSIGKRSTKAQAALPQGSSGLVSILQKLAQISRKAMPIKNPGKKSSKPMPKPAEVDGTKEADKATTSTTL